MKHVVACNDDPKRFGVYCDAARSYVLVRASASEVENYFLDIATRRARACVAQLIQAARESSTVPVTH